MTYPTRQDITNDHKKKLLNLRWLELDAARMQTIPGSLEEADLLAQQLQVEEEQAAL